MQKKYGIYSSSTCTYFFVKRDKSRKPVRIIRIAVRASADIIILKVKFSVTYDVFTVNVPEVK